MTLLILAVREVCYEFLSLGKSVVIVIVAIAKVFSQMPKRNSIYLKQEYTQAKPTLRQHGPLALSDQIHRRD